MRADAPRVRCEPLPRGLAGTVKTVRHMVQLIREGSRDYAVRCLATAILRRSGVGPKDYLGEAFALCRWVQQNIRYTRDPCRLELVMSPRRLLEVKAGDCDDMTILLASLLRSTGHAVRLVLTGRDASRQDRFSHVYLECFHQGRWVPLDATSHHPPGWEPGAPVRKVIPLDPVPGPAGRLYRRFHRRPADGTYTVRAPRAVPTTLVDLGQLVALVYRTGKGGRAERSYIHFMETPPRLCSDAGGRQLFIVGGRYRVTARGIEG